MSLRLRRATVPPLEGVPGLVHGFEQASGPSGWETRETFRLRVAGVLRASGRLLLLKQVHGSSVVHAPWEGTPEADAATADAPGLLLGIQTADCLPLLLVDPRRRVVAAAHAGWRGTAAGIAGRAVAAMVELGCVPSALLAALGPAIGRCCYEVGEEVRQAFGPEAAAWFRPGPRGRPHLDLRQANVGQLVVAGVSPGAIAHVDECTACHPGVYHSFRRDGPGAGRMLSYIGWEQET
jgi:YfiH family protein